MWMCALSYRRQTMLLLEGFLFIFVVTFVEGNNTENALCERLLSADFGKIAYPRSTHSRQDCSWVIVSTKDRLQLTFTDFVMKTTCCSCVNDFVEIRDGNNKNSSLIGRYCANSFPSMVYSTGPNLWIKFVSDFRINDQNRMRIQYKSVCGMHVYGYAGQITPMPSGSDECLYSMTVPSHRVSLNFISLSVTQSPEPETLCNSNFLMVGEEMVVMNTKKQKYTKYCLSNPIPSIYSTSGQFLWFKFVKTPINVGFTATFSIRVSGYMQCKGDVLNSQYGTITSPGYPFKYTPSSRCTWIIKGPPGKYIHLYFNTFDFGKDDDDCLSGNEVEVYSGEDSSDEDLIGRYCSEYAPAVVISKSNMMKITSFSKSSETVGFTAQFFALDKGICNLDEFECKNRKCIPFTNWCDGVTNCQDGSDETQCIDFEKKDFSFHWYKVWPVTIIVAMLVMIVWLWRIGRRSLLTRVSTPQHLSGSLGHVSDYTLPDENFAPPSYSETAGHKLLTGKLPSYEEAIRLTNGTNQISEPPSTDTDIPLMLVNRDGTVVTYPTQRQQQGDGAMVGSIRSNENVDSV